MRKPDRRLKGLRPLVSTLKVAVCWESLIGKGSESLCFHFDYITYTGERSTQDRNVECELSDNKTYRIHFKFYILLV